MRTPFGNPGSVGVDAKQLGPLGALTQGYVHRGVYAVVGTVVTRRGTLGSRRHLRLKRPRGGYAYGVGYVYVGHRSGAPASLDQNVGRFQPRPASPKASQPVAVTATVSSSFMYPRLGCMSVVSIDRTIPA